MTEERVSSDGLIHDAERLKELQALPLSRKIQISQARIIEFVERMGGVENVVVSYSGGKDSTVLLHLCSSIYPDIKCVYADTGLEYPEVRAMARKAGADFVRPKLRFDQVIAEYGYPLVGKEVAEAIYYARRVRNAGEREYQDNRTPQGTIRRERERERERESRQTVDRRERAERDEIQKRVYGTDTVKAKERWYRELKPLDAPRGQRRRRELTGGTDIVPIEE